MPHLFHRLSLTQVLHRLADEGVIPTAATVLEQSAAAAGQALRESILAEIPAFSGSANPDILPGLERHGREHIEELIRLFAGGPLGELEFVAAHARLRAEQRFPLEATLHAYLCGHKVLSHWLRDAALATGKGGTETVIAAVADLAIEYTNAISTVAAAEYVNHVRLMAEAESDQRSELLTLLLNGYDEADGRVARLLRRAGYLDQRQSYCVVAVIPAQAAELESPARAQRIISAIAEIFSGTSIRVLAGLRNATVMAILADRRRQSGWTVPQADLARRAAPLLQNLGPAVLVGVSADHPSTAFLPRAAQGASIALDFANVSERVREFSRIPLRELLVHHGASYVQSASPVWAQVLADADGRAGGALAATLRAIADADLNIQKAGRRLGKHANTVYARMERIEALTGKDPARYHDLTELLIASDCRKA